VRSAARRRIGLRFDGAASDGGAALLADVPLMRETSLLESPAAHCSLLMWRGTAAIDRQVGTPRAWLGLIGLARVACVVMPSSG
jgi:hypothetical protein